MTTALTAVEAAEPPVTALAFTPDGHLLAGSQLGIVERTWPDMAETGRIATEIQHVHDLKFSPDGRRVAVAGGTPGQSGVVEVYTWPERTLAWRAFPHDDSIYGVDWSHDGSRLATASLDRLAKMLDATSGEDILTLTGHSRGVTDVTFLGETGSIVTCGLDQSLRVWDVQSGELQRTLNNHTQPVLGMALRPSMENSPLPMIASIGEDRTARFWQPTIGRLVRFAKLPATAQALHWSADGATLYVACQDGAVRGIDPEIAAIGFDAPLLEGWAYAIDQSLDGGQIVVGGWGGQLRLAPLNP